MKRTFFMLCCCLIAVISTAQNYFYVEKTDGTKIPFAYNEVTRISFNHEQNGDSDSLTTEIPSNVIIPDGAITVAEAREICSGLSSGETTSEKYYVKGWVKKLHNSHESAVANYGNGQFYMVDNMSDSDDFMAFQVYGLNDEKLTSADQVEVGDYVVVYGQLTNYSGTYKTVGKGAAYIYSSSNEKLQGDIVIPDDDVETITIARAIEIINGLDLSGETTEEYMIKATLTQVYTTGDNVAKYGNININVTDETGSLDCYYTNNVGNVKFTSESEVPAIGTVLLLRGKLKNYAKNDVGTPEMINGYIVEIVSEGTGDNTGGDTGDVETINIARAIEIINGLALSGETDVEYQIQATLTQVYTTGENVAKYGNLNITVTDETGSLDCYYTNNVGNVKFTSESEVPAIGTVLLLRGKLKNYAKNDVGTPEMINGYIVEIIGEGTGEGTGDDTGDDGDVEIVNDGSETSPFTVAEVIALNSSKTGNYFIKAYIVGQVTGNSLSLSNVELQEPFTANDYGQWTNILIAASTDETDVKNMVPVQLSQGQMREFSLPAQPENLGKEILIFGSLEKYYGVPGIKSPTYVKVGDTEYGSK